MTWFLRMRFLEAELQMGILVKVLYWRVLGEKGGKQDQLARR